MRCTEYTLNALGIFGKSPKTFGGCIEAIDNAGYSYKFIDLYDENIKTVKAFAKKYLKGTYYISTSGHAMALVDGVLHDTEGKGIDGRRLISICKVTKR